MDYEFDYYVDVFELTKMSLKGIYRTIVGVVNIVFTVAAIGLLARFGSDMNIFLKLILVFCVFMFPVFQPIMLYNRLKKQTANMPENVKIKFSNTDFKLLLSDKEHSFKWKSVKRVSKSKNAIVVYVTDKEGYIFVRKILGDQFDDIYNSIMNIVKR